MGEGLTNTYQSSDGWVLIAAGERQYLAAALRRY